MEEYAVDWVGEEQKLGYLFEAFFYGRTQDLVVNSSLEQGLLNAGRGGVLFPWDLLGEVEAMRVRPFDQFIAVELRTFASLAAGEP